MDAPGHALVLPWGGEMEGPWMRISRLGKTLARTAPDLYVLMFWEHP